MRRFAVVTGVGQQRLQGNSSMRLIERFTEMPNIGTGASLMYDRYDQMTATIAHDANFRILPISQISMLFSASFRLFTSPHKVAASDGRFEPRGVNRSERHSRGQQRELLSHLDRMIKQPPNTLVFHQTYSRFLKRRKVRNGLQADGGGPSGRLLQQGRQLSIVESEKLFQHQTCKQLRYGKLLGRTAMPIGTNGPLAQGMSRPKQLRRRLRRSHPYNTNDTGPFV